MKSLLISGRCPYNNHQENSLQEAGVDARIYENWGIHLPEHLDAILDEQPDIVHLQWPESVCRHQEIAPEEILNAFPDVLGRLRTAGIKLFWTMHNLLPHDRAKADFWRRFYQLFADHCDVCCHHSEWGKSVALDAYVYPRAQHVVLRHGYFHQDVFPAVEKSKARQELGLPSDARIFLNVGSLRPDKQVAEIIDVFEGRQDVLLLAGSANSDYAKQQIARAESLSNVVIHPGFIDDQQVSLMANAADCFLFMQGDHHLTSGAPHLSQAYLLPQITLDFPYAREVLGEGAVYIESSERRFERLASTLDALDTSQLNHVVQSVKSSRRLWHWSVIAEETRAAYLQALR
ncbi:glycosyltransferase [Cerasicoccus fimbriatus]|uniref:glycosyltransferase n=1 Tax=Cerasicoccus fimbriatus TaxID=3014554 RepID=UPI0022B4B2F9|nr:glycosyltransferase [Cerasicoccus sp. TK19100]